jgi:beta-lactam-binding protein with PASTA domain
METQTQKSGYFQDIKAYLKSQSFLQQIIILVLITILGLFMSKWLLRSITHHGDVISVPNFEGLTIDQATKIAEDKNLFLEIVDSVYLASGKRGSVVEQNPQFNTRVKENRTIFITIKAFSAEKTEMPDLHNISLQQAKAELENYGLKIGKINYTAGYENVIIEQSYKGAIIAPNTKIAKRERIDLLLGRGDYAYTNMVDLNGLTLDDAYNRLTSAYLNIGRVNYDNTVLTSADSASAQVWKQEPTIINSQKQNFGTRIEIWLTKDKFKVLTSKVTPQLPTDVPTETTTVEPEENI